MYFNRELCRYLKRKQVKLIVNSVNMVLLFSATAKHFRNKSNGSLQNTRVSIECTCTIKFGAVMFWFP